MLSAPRCATRMDLPRESFLDSGYLNGTTSRGGSSTRADRRSLRSGDARSTSMFGVLLIADASRSSNREIAYGKPRPAIASTTPRRPPRPRRRDARWMQSCILPGQRRESGSLRHPSLRDPSQLIPPADCGKFAGDTRVTNTKVAGDGSCACCPPMLLP
jgi:hypothetical protein